MIPIYEHKTSMTVTGGSSGTVSLRIVGGIATYLLIRANTATTIFQANMTDDDGIIRRNYDYHEGEIADHILRLPVQGSYTINVTNSSPNDTFRIILAVRER